MTREAQVPVGVSKINPWTWLAPVVAMCLIIVVSADGQMGFIPVGQAWLQVAKDFPMKTSGGGRSINETDPETLDGLMYGDPIHQSFTGSLFNSMMVWRYLTAESPAELNLSPTAKGVGVQARRLVAWDKLPYLVKVVDESIMPAAGKVR